MDIADIERHLDGLGGVLTLRPVEGDGSPEVAWNDLFFYYAPDGVVPHGQPFATVITKDYPDEPAWHTGPGSFRVNVHVGTERFGELIGQQGPPAGTPDEVTAHPAYARVGWICVVDPGQNASRIVLEELTGAHAAAQRRFTRKMPGR